MIKLSKINELIEKGYTCVDMHIHTEYSDDSYGNIKKYLKKAKKLNMGLGVTDHNEIKGAVYAFNNSNGVLVIPGIEVKAHNGLDVLIYFYNLNNLIDYYNKYILPRKKKNNFVLDITEKEIITSALKYKCVIGIPHPFAPRYLGLGWTIEHGTTSNNLIKKIHFVEAVNGAMGSKVNEKAEDWARFYNKKITGGSDAHTVFHFGKVLTCIKLDENEHFLDGFLKKDAVVIGKGASILTNIMFILGQFKLLKYGRGMNGFFNNLKTSIFLRTRKPQNGIGLPNKITLLRIVLIPFAVAFLFLDVVPYNFLISTILFLLIMLTDVIDGMIARKFNMITKLGSFLDPLADKVVILLYFIFLLSVGIYPAWLVIIFVGRELIVDGFRNFAVSQNICVKANKGGKAKAFLQTVSIISGLVYISLINGQLGRFNFDYGILKSFAYYSMLVSLFVSFIGIHYIFKKNFFTLIKGANKLN